MACVAVTEQVLLVTGYAKDCDTEQGGGQRTSYTARLYIHEGMCWSGAKRESTAADQERMAHVSASAEMHSILQSLPRSGTRHHRHTAST